MSRDPVWTRRRKRVERLRADHLHAAELLAFYDDVLALQEPLCAKARKAGWLGAVEAADGRAPRLRLTLLPLRPRERDFPRFVRSVPASATEVLRAGAGRLSAEPGARSETLAAGRGGGGGAGRAVAERLRPEPAAMSELLAAVLGGEPVEAIAARIDCEAAALAFFPRAFVQPVAEGLVAGAHRDVRGHGADDGAGAVARGDEARAVCPDCGAAPVAAVLRDEPATKGRRTLLCSLCQSEWAFPRTRCPACGEERAEKRPHHVSESWPHIRLEECGSCRTYLKAIDLRESGLAVPVVDELASVELDLWAGEQGLSKLQTNLLGM